MENETKETEKTIEPEFKPQVNLSPTSINTFFRCPRKYFYNYIAKLKTKPSIHLVKGSIVHKILEDFFREYTSDMKGRMDALLEKNWEKNEKQLGMLNLTEAELETARLDILNIITEYYITVSRKMKALIDIGKAENDRHAYFLIKPKLKEMYIKNEEIHCVGYIDRVSKDWDGLITLGDYKTSSKFGMGLPAEYRRQLAIYSLLYYLKENELPDFVAVDFLRYGEEYLLEVTPSLLQYARTVVTDTYAKTRSTELKDYPKIEGNLCRWCDYIDICSGKKEWEKQVRLQAIKDTLKKKEEESEVKNDT